MDEFDLDDEDPDDRRYAQGYGRAGRALVVPGPPPWSRSTLGALIAALLVVGFVGGLAIHLRAQEQQHNAEAAELSLEAAMDPDRSCLYLGRDANSVTATCSVDVTNNGLYAIQLSDVHSHELTVTITAFNSPRTVLAGETVALGFTSQVFCADLDSAFQVVPLDMMVVTRDGRTHQARPDLLLKGTELEQTVRAKC